VTPRIVSLLPSATEIAAQEGRVFLCEGQQYFNRPGPRLVETLEIVAEALHPGAFGFGHEGSGWERMPRVS
jgi:iron complex transport system substrate-binding protein